MSDIQEQLRTLGLHLPDILVPNDRCDLHRWAVVACDQYTSEPEYWKEISEYVGANPSTLRLIYPEVYLDAPDVALRIDGINATMRSYLSQQLFTTYEQSFFLVNRSCKNGVGRWGLLVALDLEQYDYSKDSKSLIRATEGTILSRIPPRKAIRKDALLELPHILVLIDDPLKTVIEPLVDIRGQLPKVYETTLMAKGGSVRAYQIKDESSLTKLYNAFAALHGNLDPDNRLLFAMGDGNHSLATAKSCWEDIKSTLTEEEQEDHPARFALVELENIYDPALEFEPIHRVLFNIDSVLFFNELTNHCKSFTVSPVSQIEELIGAIHSKDGKQRFGYVDADSLQLVTIEQGSASIVAGTLQSVIDTLLAVNSHVSVDYIHGSDVTVKLGSKGRNIGLLLPPIDKSTFFSTIINDGALPRKTFSMGQAHEKRYYLEARRITK